MAASCSPATPRAPTAMMNSVTTTSTSEKPRWLANWWARVILAFLSRTADMAWPCTVLGYSTVYVIGVSPSPGRRLRELQRVHRWKSALLRPAGDGLVKTAWLMGCTVLILLPLPGDAEIYRYRDATGTWVFSDRPPPGHLGTPPTATPAGAQATQ
ncbi:DUF4124 domain-containing protein, partial [Thiohalocapsa sp.]|uniref:DUF4124 domain-containing protein n=1 Tax=Thiohalocapsa sp. TaxID=2497641 RepID=UPI00345C4D67